MKSKCPECSTMIEVDINELEEGDIIECPECIEDLVIEIENGSVRLITEEEKKLKEMEEIEEELDFED